MTIVFPICISTIYFIAEEGHCHNMLLYNKKFNMECNCATRYYYTKVAHTNMYKKLTETDRHAHVKKCL